MKQGFYLSPDGLHIVELIVNKNIYFLDVIGFDGEFEDFLFDICLSDAPIIFSSWQKLE